MGQKLMTPKERAAQIHAVSAQEVMSVAQDIFVAEGLNLSLIGPFKDKKRFLKLLKIS